MRVLISSSIFFILLFNSSNFLFSQKKDEASIQKQLAEATTSIQKIEAYSSLIDFYIHTDFNIASKMALKMKELESNADAKGKAIIKISELNLYDAKGDEKTFIEKSKTLRDLIPLINDKKILGDCYDIIGKAKRYSNEWKVSVIYHKKALVFYQKMAVRDRNLIAENYRQIALDFLKSSEMKDSAEYWVNLSISTLPKDPSLSNPIKGFINCKNTQAKLYQLNGQIDMSVSINDQCLKQAKKLNHKDKEAKIYREIGESYIELNNFTEAQQYITRSLQLSKQINDRRNIGLAHINNAWINLNLNPTKASKDALKGLNILEEIGNIDGLGKAYNVFGMIYLKQKEYDKAIECLNKSIINYVKTNNSDEISNVYHNIGTVFIAQKKLNKATEYLNKSISIRKKNKGSIDKINKSYKVLSDLYYEKGDIKNSLNYLKYYSNYRDSNFVIQSSLKIQQKKEEAERLKRIANQKVQTDSINQLVIKQKITNAELETTQIKNNLQATIIFGIIVIMVLGAVIIFYWWSQIKIKQEQKEVEMSQTLLRSQMNPHFVFNAMSVIQSYIYENNPSKSSKFLVNFSRLMRLILENSPKEFISLETEVEILMKYLTTQKLRFEERFEFNINYDENLISSKVIIPPMITQPFIENAIEHGQLHNVKNGFINIDFKCQDKMLQLTITDNGIGRKQSALNSKSKNHRSMAMKITKDRIDIINSKFKSSGIMKIEDYDKVEQTGTKVTIRLPLKHEKYPKL
ncbi:MAG: tetratricopeptide repeat protein [Crocinitomicaceae bacterium]|nr:tetratricopeptide repeat protein [Crocinitomicaceae bacterium]